MPVGIDGDGATPHLADELFEYRAGVDIVHVTCRGRDPTIVGLRAGG